MFSNKEKSSKELFHTIRSKKVSHGFSGVNNLGD